MAVLICLKKVKRREKRKKKILKEPVRKVLHQDGAS